MPSVQKMIEQTGDTKLTPFALDSLTTDPKDVELSDSKPQEKKGRVNILFGGTFDPPHMGHRLCIETALDHCQKLGYDAKVLVVPSYAPPTSATGLKDTRTSFRHRSAMASLAFAEFNPLVVISDLEAQLPNPSYTRTTIQHLKSGALNHLGFSQEPWTLLIGWDQWLHLPQWYQAAQLALEVDLWVMPRGNTPTFEWVQSVRSHAHEFGFQRINWVNPKEVTIYTQEPKTWKCLEPHQLIPARSEWIRKQAFDQIIQGSQIFLQPVIQGYINHHRLYSHPKETP